MPLFRHASFTKFWKVNQKKNVVVDRPVKEFNLKCVGVFKCIDSVMLLKSFTVPRLFIMDVIIGFYSNLSISMFDAKSPDYRKAFVRGNFFDMSPELINEFVTDTVVVESELSVDPDTIADCITGEKGTTWPSKGYFPASALSKDHKVLHKLALKN